MTITHYNIKQQGTRFQVIGPTETQSNTQSPKCLRNWQFPGSSKVADILFLLWNRAQALLVKLRATTWKNLRWHASTPHHTEDQQKPQVQVYLLPLQEHLPPCERQAPFHWNPLNGNLGMILPFTAGFVQGLTALLHRVSPTLPHGLTCGPAPPLQVPLLIFHRSNGLTHFVKDRTEWPVS